MNSRYGTLMENSPVIQYNTTLLTLTVFITRRMVNEHKTDDKEQKFSHNPILIIMGHSFRY